MINTGSVHGKTLIFYHDNNTKYPSKAKGTIKGDTLVMLHKGIGETEIYYSIHNNLVVHQLKHGTKADYPKGVKL